MARPSLRFLVFAVACLTWSGVPYAVAQSSTVVAGAGDKPDLTQPELEQLLAPIALYPDTLLSQILMASTYPLEVVEAERWLKANPNLTGDALAQALDKQDWEASVKSLVNFPDVVTQMSENLDKTQTLGDAVLGQEKQVMQAIQDLRSKAQAAGNLDSNDQVNVSTQSDVIVIEQADPQVIYVPQYNPVVVYGTWPYAAYPPYSYYPPGYRYGGVVAGVALGAAWGYAWGRCRWGRGDIDIDVNRNLNFNRNINRNNIGNRNGKWNHDARHRRNAPHRNARNANRHGGRSRGQAHGNRRPYRGHSGGNRPSASSLQRDLGRSRSGANRSRGSANNRYRTPNRSRNRSHGYSGSHRSRSSSHHASRRGHSSRNRSMGHRGGGRSRGHSRGGGRRGGGRRR